MRKLTFLLALLCASVMGWAATYCDFATGHENNANFGDANGRILLTLVPTENANEYTLTVKPNYANGATKKLDYLYVIAGGNTPYPAEAGADEGGTGYDELSVTFTNSNATASFTIQWSNPDWGGRWQCTLTDVALSELTSCSGGGDPDPEPEPEPEPEPAANPYCDFATGHENNPNFGDANGRILLSLEPTGNTNEYKLTLKPNYDNGATKKLDYMYVIAGGNSPYPAEAGIDESGIGYDELAVTFTNSSATASFMIQWSNPDWGGRWQCTLTDVDFSKLAPCSAPAIASEYCGQEMSSGNTLARFTWETTAEGNVNITISEALGGATNASYFRGNGITDTKIKIGEGRDPITTYFTHPGNIQGQQTLTLTLTDPANAPAPGTKIYVENQIIEYATSKDGNAWPTLSFEYTYGGVCAEEKVLTEISLTASSTFALVGEGVTLTAQGLDQMGMPIEAEISFKVSPAAAGNFAGNVFTFAKTGVATITAKSGAVEKSITLYGVPSDNLALNKTSKGGYYDNNPAEGFDKANDGNNNTAWVTYADKPASVEWWYVDLGDAYSITAVDVVWGDPSSTSYKVYARMDAPTEEQEADDEAWEEIASVSGIGINSEQFNEVSVNARYIRIHSLTKSANFLRMKEVSVFGTAYVPVVDTEKPVMTSASLASSTYTEAVVNVAATDNVGIYRYHVVDAGNSIDANFAESEGKITINNLQHGTAYNFTITAKDAAGNESDNSVVVNVTTPFDGSIDLALNKPCEAGVSRAESANASKVNDGLDTNWETGDNADYADQWWYVDLGEIYNIDRITIRFENARSNHFLLQGRTSAPSAAQKADDGAWNTLYEVTSEPQGDYALNEYNMGGKVARYVRFKSLSNTYNNQWGNKIRELCVYGSGIATVDAEAPVMTSASLVSFTDSRAIIAVAATDNQGVAKFHVADAGNSFDGNFAAVEGNITVNGLTQGTHYTFVITAVDYFDNESENSKSVEVTTSTHYTQPQSACPAPTWDASLVKAMYSPTYSANYNHQDWGSGTVATEDEFGRKYVTNGNGYFGADGFALNCLLMEKLHYDIWIADDATVRFVPIWGGAEQGITKALVGQQWNSIDINLSEYTGITNWGNIYQMKIDQASNLTFWVANAYFYREAAYVDTEAPTNVNASKIAEGFHSVSISAQADDNSGAVSFKIMNGEEQVATGAAAAGVATTIVVNGLASGTNYNFNVIAYDEAGNEAAPVVVAAATKTLPAPAPAPDLNGKKVVNVFSDAMEGSKTIHSGGWGETTQVEWMDIAPGDKVFYGRNFNYAGWHSWGSNIDATGMTYLHVDVYSLDMTKVSVTPISEGHEGVANITLTPNAWTSADIALSEYAANNIDWSAIFQFKFMNPVDGNELLIDNVYFYRPADYTRNVTDGNYGTICLPQAGEIVGATLYEIADYANGMIYVDEVEGGVMAAGKPYIFQATSNKLDVYYTSAAIEETAGENNGLHGFYNLENENAQFDIPADAGNYILYQNQYWLVSGRAAYIANYRAYIKIGEINYVAPAPGRRRVAMNVNGEQTATGINELNAAEAPVKMIMDGQLYILRGEKLYDATGRLVK